MESVKWRITNQAEGTGQLNDGSYGRGYRVTFQTSDGLTGSVFVGKGQYTKENVLAKVREEANTMAEIQKLSE
jgi:hypothetical protein